MNDALSSASASFEVLQRQLSDCVNAVDMLQKTIKPSKSLASSTSSASVTTLMVCRASYHIIILFSFIPNQFEFNWIYAAFPNDLGNSCQYGSLIASLPNTIPSARGCQSAATERGTGMNRETFQLCMK